MATNIHYLSRLIDKPVRDFSGRPVGTVGDMIVRLTGSYPPVTGVILRLGSPIKGKAPLATFLNWNQVGSVSKDGITLTSARLDLQQFRRRPGELLLDADLQDQQVIDLQGRKLVRVNDVQLVSAGARGSELRLAGVDIGPYGLLRRLDLEGFAHWAEKRLRLPISDRVIPWATVEPIDLADLPPDQFGAQVANVELESVKGRPSASRAIQFRHDKLAALHPADVAELVEQLAAPDRAEILESFEPETAAEAIGELDPEMQADVLEDLSTAAAQAILAELPPDEAADALAEMEPERAHELLQGLDHEDAADIRELMSYPEETAGAMMTSAYIALQATMTAQETIETLRELAPPAEEIFYVYVVDAAERLSGVISLRDLILAKPELTIGNISRSENEVVSVRTDTPLDEVIEAIEKYNLLAVPVLDSEARLVGVITIDDALSAAVPDDEDNGAWMPRLRR